MPQVQLMGRVVSFNERAYDFENSRKERVAGVVRTLWLAQEGQPPCEIRVGDEKAFRALRDSVEFGTEVVCQVDARDNGKFYLVQVDPA